MGKKFLKFSPYTKYSIFYLIFSIGLSEENLRYHLKRLTDDGILCRFEAGIYYFPKTDIFGERMAPETAGQPHFHP